MPPHQRCGRCSRERPLLVLLQAAEPTTPVLRRMPQAAGLPVSEQAAVQVVTMTSSKGLHAHAGVVLVLACVCW